MGVSAGSVVLVTGGASGIGRLAAQKMADAGAHVVAVDVNEPGLRTTAHGRECIHTRTLDVTDARAVEEAVQEIQNELGPVDRVYNAAAIMPTSPLVDQGIDVIRNVMDTNFGGVTNVSPESFSMPSRKALQLEICGCSRGEAPPWRGDCGAWLRCSSGGRCGQSRDDERPGR